MNARTLIACIRTEGVGAARIAAAYAVTCAVCWGCLLAVSVATADERPASIPHGGTDWITLLTEGGRLNRVRCRIEEIKGETITIRRNAGASLEFFRFSRLEQIFFVRSADWLEGVTRWESGNRRRGLEYMDRAIQREQRPWARNELLAYSAVYLVRAGQRNAAVERLAEVYQSDPQTRHVSLLPLVWDARLVNDEKVTAPVEDLTAEAVIRQLVACSVWLHVPDHRAEAVATLTKLRRGGGNTRLCALAEAQLWRDQLLNGDPSVPIPDHYHDLIRQFPADARGGPSLVLGRLQAQRHQYDQAALSLLWLPLMQADDGPLAASAMVECLRCLQQAGRPAQARHLERQLYARFPLASATAAFGQTPP